MEYFGEDKFTAMKLFFITHSTAVVVAENHGSLVRMIRYDSMLLS